ncbi:MAG: hypothetical protein SGPRY_010119 [Prymnesium sp.]
MAVRSSFARALGGTAGASLLGYQALPAGWRSEALDDFSAALLSSASAQLTRLGASAQPAAPALAPSAEVSALLVSQQALGRTIDHLLRAQTRSQARAALGWLLPATAMAALVGAWYRWGWEGFGWVSMEQMQEGLTTLKQNLSDKIHRLKHEIMLRFTQVEEAIHHNRGQLDQVNAGVNDLREQGERGNAMMHSLEGRLGTLERHTQRSAQGVELLVHLVSASNLFADVDDHSLTMLREFTGEPPAPTPTRAVPELPAPIITPRLERSSSSFMQMLLSPAVTST